MDAFHQLLQWLERIIYTVDEWLRFRAGDPRSFVVGEAAPGNGLGRDCLRHPVLRDAAHRAAGQPDQALPRRHGLAQDYASLYVSPVGDSVALIVPLLPSSAPTLATTFATTIILLLPGVFGFLVWELRETGGCTRRTARRPAVPMPSAAHGETMPLDAPGHPLRHAAQALHDGLRRLCTMSARPSTAGPHRSSRRAAGSRILASPLHRTDALPAAPRNRFLRRRIPIIGRVHLATNRIEVELVGFRRAARRCVAAL